MVKQDHLRSPWIIESCIRCRRSKQPGLTAARRSRVSQNGYLPFPRLFSHGLAVVSFALRTVKHLAKPPPVEVSCVDPVSVG